MKLLFRLPTPDELAAMEAFMRSLDFPAGTDPNKFNLNNFIVNSGTITATVPAGASTGLITVTTLDGTATSATSFTISTAPFALGATPSSQTVSAGAATNYTVTISRSAGFADNLNFSVTGLPAATTATFSPNPTTGNSSTMTVTTTARSAQLAPWQTMWAPPANFGVRAWPLAICLLVIVLLAYRERARRQIPRWVFASGAFAVLLCVGCGGGGSTPPPPPPGERRREPLRSQ